MNTLKSIITIIAFITLSNTTYAANIGDYQGNALLSPSSYQLKAESKGRVMIYDQMDNETVELALNTQFDRIDSMMFVRTQYLQKDGTIEEEDDCD